MALWHDTSARLLGRTAPTYGEQLRFEGSELPEPSIVVVPTRHGDVSCLHYPGPHPCAMYVHFHGGAFMMRHPEMDDFWARFVVSTTGISTVLPDYSVAPQVRYPVAHEQAHDVCAAFGRRGQLVVGGFSGGGGLAASAALQARDTGAVDFVGQLLAVPSVDIAEAVEDKVASNPASMINRRLLRLVRATYFKDADRRSEPYASPMRAKDLAGLAPALVLTAQADSLRREGERYAQRLTEAGVQVETRLVPGVDHYFLHGAGPAQARNVMEFMARWIAQRCP